MALDPSLAEMVEYIESIAKMHEKEYLQRKRVVANISFERPEETEGLLQVWLTEPHIDKAWSTENEPLADPSSSCSMS